MVAQSEVDFVTNVAFYMSQKEEISNEIQSSKKASASVRWWKVRGCCATDDDDGEFIRDWLWEEIFYDNTIEVRLMAWVAVYSAIKMWILDVGTMSDVVKLAMGATSSAYLIRRDGF